MLTATYTPDSGSSSIYTSATGTAPVTVTQAIGTPHDLEPQPESGVLRRMGDFNDDCKINILWRNSSTQQVCEWLMSGPAVTGAGNAGTPASYRGLSIVALTAGVAQHVNR